MGGMTAASLLARDGYSVLVLEASHVPGGCSSSYYRKGYIFESGATTLIGFDQNQPLRILEKELGIDLPKEPISPSMTVHMDGKKIIRWQNRDEWVKEVITHFQEAEGQRKFWKTAFFISDIVWKVSGRNRFFPPTNLSDALKLLKNDPRDVRILPYALKSVKKFATGCGITNPAFFKFLDEQLLISAQSYSDDTPFLFGAPAITYTNYTNFYVPGGLIKMVEALRDFIELHDGKVVTKKKVKSIERVEEAYEVTTEKDEVFRGQRVISNVPVWNMKELTHGKVGEYFENQSKRYNWAWGAFTMGIATDDVYEADMTLHHQIHVEDIEEMDLPGFNSVFVSFSSKGDTERAPKGERVLNVSTHTVPDFWFNLNGEYEAVKKRFEDKILALLRKRLPGFSNANVKLVFSSTPVTWKNWVYRAKGRVGGIPQSMNRSLLDWTPANTPFEGLYLCGDTVYPGQGIPGVTLSGINVYSRVKQKINHHTRSH